MADFEKRVVTSQKETCVAPEAWDGVLIHVSLCPAQVGTEQVPVCRHVRGLYRESIRLEASGQQPPRRSASPGLCDGDSIFDAVALMWPFGNWGHFDTAILKLWKIS